MAELTPREREVLTLAAHMSDKNIGLTLGMKTSTVSNTLASAYKKLGASGRESALRKLGIDYLGRPLPMEARAIGVPIDGQPEHDAGGDQRGRTSGSVWPLPDPPRRVIRLVQVLPAAILAFVVAMGLGALIYLSANAVQSIAPPHAIRLNE